MTGTDAPQNYDKGGSFRVPLVIQNPPLSFRIPSLSFRTAVRNLKSPPDGQPIPTTTHHVSSILGSSSCAPQNDRGGGAPQNDNNGVSFRVPLLSFRVPLLSFRVPSLPFRTAVRNLRSPSDGLFIPTTTHHVSSILDSSSCAPQNDRGGGAPQNDNNGVSFRVPLLSFRVPLLSFRVPLLSFRVPSLSFRTAVRNLRSPSDGLFIPTTTHHVSSILDSSSCAPQNDR